MSRHNRMLFMSIQCITSLFSRCIVGHPTLVNLTSLSIGNHFHRSIKGAYNCIHSRVRSPLLSPRWLHICAKKKKKGFPPLPSLFAICRSPSVRLWFSFAIGRISSPTIAENNKLFCIITVNLNASLFDSQLNCHSD